MSTSKNQQMALSRVAGMLGISVKLLRKLYPGRLGKGINQGMVEGFQSDPPAWLKRARSEQQERKALQPYREAAGFLSINARKIYRAAQAAGADQDFTVEQAKAWSNERSTAPEWVVALWVEEGQRKVERHLKRQALQRQQEEQRKADYSKVWDRLSKGEKRFRGNQRDHLEDIAFNASIRLVRGAKASGLLAAELQALRLMSVNPDRHSTWALHGGGCDGKGKVSGCEERAAQLEAEAEDQRKAQRMQRAVESRRSSEAIAGGAFSVNSSVELWRGNRAGKVVKINRTTVTVRHVGPKVGANFEIVEKRYSASDLEPLRTGVAHETGDQIQCTPYGDNFLREATVVDTDGPLMLVEYVIGSGQHRKKWIDITRIQVG